jgi:hypothetical protein
LHIPSPESSPDEPAETASSSESIDTKVARISDKVAQEAEMQIKEATFGRVTQFSPTEDTEAKMARMMAEAVAHMKASARRAHSKYYPVEHLRRPKLPPTLVSSTDVLHSMKAKRDLQAGDPKPNLTSSTSTGTKTSDNAAGFGITVYAVIVLGGVLAFGAYKYFESQQAAKA